MSRNRETCSSTGISYEDAAKTVALFTLLSLFVAICFTVPQHPAYRAEAALEIQNVNGDFLNTKQVNPVAESSDVNLLTDVQTQMKIIESDPLIDRVLQKLKSSATLRPIYAQAKRPSLLHTILGSRPTPSDLDYTVHLMMKKNLSIQEMGQTRIVGISFKSTDPHLAAEFVNTLASEYIDSNIEARWKMSERTGQWLSQQLGEMRTRLEKSEAALQAYASRSGLLFVAPPSGKSGQDDVSEGKLLQIQQALSNAQAERAAAQSRFEIARSASPDSLGDVLNDRPLRDLQAKLADLRRQRAELIVTYKAKHEKVQAVEAQIASLQNEFDKEHLAIMEHIRLDYDTALRREKLLEVAYASQIHVVTEQAGKSIQYSILKREVDSNRQLYQSTLQQVKEAAVASAIRASNVRIVNPAQVPDRPSSPSLPMNCAGGLTGGLLMGVIFAVISDRHDRTLHAPGDAKLWTNLRELGTIPSVRIDKIRRAGVVAGEDSQGRKQTESTCLLSSQRPDLVADAFRSLLTSLMFSTENGSGPQILVVTSASRMEGKTSVVSNLGIAMAQTCRSVLIVDGDLRRPRLHDMFNISNERGLSTLLSCENFDAERVTEHVAQTAIPGLHVLTSGPSSSSAAPNLLYSDRLADVLANLRKTYDKVLIDTPPMLQMSDARIFGKLADGVLVVVRARKMTRDAARAIDERLIEDGIPVLGTILNDWGPAAIATKLLRNVRRRISRPRGRQ